ncbi:MAG: hypothetical protein WC711_04075 [Candidatus Staskawiczbacteria bacterium]|jgi:hypothetical protein
MTNIDGIKRKIAEIRRRLKIKKYRWNNRALENKLYILKRVLASKRKNKAKLKAKEKKA